MHENLWGGDVVDMDAYLERIGHAGPVNATANTLHALVQAHIEHIPFENLDVILGRGVALDLTSVQEKLLRNPRGGYCYEHVMLLAAVLERLGFEFHAYSARVRLGAAHLLAATHAVLDVYADGQRWLADVGFGAGTLEPLPLSDGARAHQGGWTFRLDQEQAMTGRTWVLRQQRPDGWFDLHAFTEDRQFPIDYRVGNFYISEHPRSPFRGQAVLQRTEPELRRILTGAPPTFRTERPNGLVEEQAVPVTELPSIAAEYFAIELSDQDAATWVRTAAGRDGVAPPDQ